MTASPNDLLIIALKSNDFEQGKFWRYNGATNIPYAVGLAVNNYKTYFNGDKQVLNKWLRMLNGVDR
jgi:hypothetical protein